MTATTWRATSLRWVKFNLVGAIGIGVQLGMLALLSSGVHLNYMLVTALAVEAAVLHNFVWHEHFTWADRPSRRLRGSLVRLARFNLTTGAVSILGNLLLMRSLVGQRHLPLLLANAISIAGCSLVNFLVSEYWVFQVPLWPVPDKAALGGYTNPRRDMYSPGDG